jgi:hypothetical protein
LKHNTSEGMDIIDKLLTMNIQYEQDLFKNFNFVVLKILLIFPKNTKIIQKHIFSKIFSILM